MSQKHSTIGVLCNLTLRIVTHRSNLWSCRMLKRKMITSATLRPRQHYTTPEEFENAESLAMKTPASNVFRPHFVGEIFKNATTTGHFGFVFEKNNYSNIFQNLRILFVHYVPCLHLQQFDGYNPFLCLKVSP